MEYVLAYFSIQFQRLLGGTDENQELLSQVVIPRTEVQTTRTQKRRSKQRPPVFQEYAYQLKLYKVSYLNLSLNLWL